MGTCQLPWVGNGAGKGRLQHRFDGQWNVNKLVLIRQPDLGHKVNEDKDARSESSQLPGKEASSTATAKSQAKQSDNLTGSQQVVLLLVPLYSDNCRCLHKEKWK